MIRRREETHHEKMAKFARYRLARAKKVNAHGDKTYNYGIKLSSF